MSRPSDSGTSLRQARGAALALLACLFSACAALALDPRPITFESLESRRLDGGPVFNRVTFIPALRARDDLWLMRQSHGGRALPLELWDHLSIQRGKFSQTDATGGAVPPRASCTACHAGGPRALRPNYASAVAPVSAWDRARIALWNARIRATDPASAPVPDPSHALLRPTERPAPPTGALTVHSCVRCHYAGPGGRGFIDSEKSATAAFLLNEGFMPPGGRAVPAGERRNLQRFLRGLPQRKG